MTLKIKNSEIWLNFFLKLRKTQRFSCFSGFRNLKLRYGFLMSKGGKSFYQCKVPNT